MSMIYFGFKSRFHNFNPMSNDSIIIVLLLHLFYPPITAKSEDRPANVILPPQSVGLQIPSPLDNISTEQITQ